MNANSVPLSNDYSAALEALASEAIARDELAELCGALFRANARVIRLDPALARRVSAHWQPPNYWTLKPRQARRA